MLFNSYPFIFLFLPIALIGYFVLIAEAAPEMRALIVVSPPPAFRAREDRDVIGGTPVFESLLYPGVGGKAQIIIGPSHNDLPAFNLNDRAFIFLNSAEIGVIPSFFDFVGAGKIVTLLE